MNGRKVRALRKIADKTHGAIGTIYQTEKRFDSFGRQREVLKSPRVLVKGCHRAVYQQLKKA